MYAANIDTKRHTFQASGSLWQDALVMQDLESKSLWSQVSGECIMGDQEGKTLTLVPALHTTFSEFKSLYPQGQVLAKPERGNAGSHYEKYFSDSSRLGIFGRVDNFERAPAKSKVYGLRIGGKRIAIAEELLAKEGFALLSEITPMVVVTYDPATHTAAGFALPSLDDQGSVRVSETHITMLALGGPGGRWNARTGKVEKGNGTDLEPVPLISAFWFAWASFFPDTELVE